MNNPGHLTLIFICNKLSAQLYFILDNKRKMRSKNLCLQCNAQFDPVLLWEWEEGSALFSV